MRINSVIFHSPKLAELRQFYEGILNLPLGTYQRDGQTFPDFDDTYVNYHLENGLLCFEISGSRVDMGTVVLNVAHFSELRQHLEKYGVPILSGNEHFFKIKDPEGRSLIIEPLDGTIKT